MDYVEFDKKTGKNKPSKRALYRQRAKHLKTDPAFDDEIMPDEIAYFHRIFFEVWDMEHGITYQNLYYWQKIYGIRLTSDIINMFKMISGKCSEFLQLKRQ
jgi:hypothetical protein